MSLMTYPRDHVTAPLRWGVRHGLPAFAFHRGTKAGLPSARLVTESGGTTMDQLVPLLEEFRPHRVYRTELSNVTVHHDLVKGVLSSPHFRSDLINRLPGVVGFIAHQTRPTMLSPVEAPSLLMVDGEDHTRYRKLVTRVFSAKAVRALSDRAERVAADLLDDLERDAAAGRDVDLVERYCARLPVTMICEILGVPTDQADLVLELGSGAAASLDFGLTWREFRRVESSLMRFDTWLGDHLATLRRNPGDNLLSQLVTATGDDGVGLSDHELKATAGLVLAAGFETTVNLLGNGISLLVEHPEQLATLRERPGLWATATDEVLRYDPPVLLTGRVAAEDCEVDGERFERGQFVVCLLAGANRDPDVFTDPSRFDVSRDNARDHVSFSAGSHYCLGASLARMEGEIGLRSLFERYPDLALLPGANRRPTRILRGWEHLPARLA